MTRSTRLAPRSGLDARSPLAVVATIVLCTLLLASAAELQAVRERNFPQNQETSSSLYIQSGTAVRRLSGAYAALAADLYWIRAIQYYGGLARTLQEQARRESFIPPPPPSLTAVDEAFPLLYAMLDIVTTLDPRFTIAYRFGAVFLAEAYPRGAARPDLAVKLLEKGLAQQPDKWEYMEDIGFVHYWFIQDFRGAARWFERAAGVPGAPAWLRPLAATTLAQGGDRRSSRAMWEAIRASSDVDWLRQSAERRLAQLQALDTIDSLQRVVDDYAARTGQTPDWTAIARARMLPGIPLDPTGVPFELTREGRVLLSRRSSLWPPPNEPAGLARPRA
jgi:hypothetical protein